jgi:FkbM family methyltransferase
LALKFLRQRVKDLENVTIHPVALSDHGGKVTLYDCQRDGANTYIASGTRETVVCKDISQVMDEIGPVDLMHLNAEGSEMDIIERLVDTGQIANVDYLMIQWHPYNISIAHRIGRIGDSLRTTHHRKVGPRAWELFKRS